MNNIIKDSISKKQGKEMYQWACDLFPLNRSLTGKANRETLGYIKKILPDLKIKSFKSNKKVFDWVIPKEWNVYEAYIEDENHNRIVDFKVNNLHLYCFVIFKFYIIGHQFKLVICICQSRRT